jgi:hypothetical protein
METTSTSQIPARAIAYANLTGNGWAVLETGNLGIVYVHALTDTIHMANAALKALRASRGADLVAEVRWIATETFGNVHD